MFPVVEREKNEPTRFGKGVSGDPGRPLILGGARPSFSYFILSHAHISRKIYRFFENAFCV